MKVVIAEDDFRVSLIHEETVRQIEGMEVVAKALNGGALKDILRTEAVDLLLLDIYFPDVTGTDLLPILRKEYPSLDIIIISASNNRADLLTAKRYGVYQFLVKPVSVERLRQILMNYRTDYDWLSSEGDFKDENAEYFLTSLIMNHSLSPDVQLPSGIDTITLKKIKESMQSSHGVSIEEICRNIGVSRTTARRYLEYLVSEDQAETLLSYGEVGRPERKYILK